jgi:2-methylcitrate dehydratase PrpD
MQAKYSVPYVVGAIAVYGALGNREFDESALAHPGIQRIMPLVTGGPLPGHEWTTDVRYETEPPTRLELKLKGRQAVTKLVDKVRGYPQGGLFTREEAGQKFLDCASPTLGTARAREVLDRLLNLEQVLKFSDVAQLLRTTA